MSIWTRMGLLGARYWKHQYEGLRDRHLDLIKRHQALRSLKCTPAPDEGLWQRKFVELEKDFFALERELQTERIENAERCHKLQEALRF